MWVLQQTNKGLFFFFNVKIQAKCLVNGVLWELLELHFLHIGEVEKTGLGDESELLLFVLLERGCCTVSLQHRVGMASDTRNKQSRLNLFLFVARIQLLHSSSRGVRSSESVFPILCCTQQYPGICLSLSPLTPSGILEALFLGQITI